MKLATRCIPLGTLPYNDIDLTGRMAAKLFEKIPFLPILPLVDSCDSVERRTLEDIPLIKVDGKKLTLLQLTNKEKKELEKLDKAFNTPNVKILESYAIKSPYIEKFINLIKKFKSPNAIVNLLGPFSISQMLNKMAEEQMLIDRSYRKLFVQSVCVKALWIIDKMKEVNPDIVPIIMLEEPLLGQIGVLKRENEDITSELIISLFNKTIEKLKESGAVVGIQCLEKCDWKVPIQAGADIISFDAYNNPNNLCIIPEAVNDFIDNGGLINWGIVPITSESLVKSLNIDFINKRLLATMDGLILAGVPREKVYNSALVSINGNTEHLSLIFAEKAVMLSNQLSKRIPVIK